MCGHNADRCRFELAVLGDTSYGAGELREHLLAGGHALVIKPPPPRPAVSGAFTIDLSGVFSYPSVTSTSVA
jgi:hypothetical protein